MRKLPDGTRKSEQYIVGARGPTGGMDDGGYARGE